MFGTLKSSGTSGDPYLIETTKPPFDTQDVGRHQTNACTTCREKKLKCTGDKTGCRRCRTKGTQCIYLALGESKNGQPRKATATVASKRAYGQNQGSFTGNDSIDGPLTSGQQSTESVQKEQGGMNPGSQYGSGPGALSDINGEKSSPRTRQSTFPSSRSFEGTNAFTSDINTDAFDFEDLNGNEAYNDNTPIPLSFENDSDSLHNDFDPSGFLNDDPWIDSVPNLLQSDQREPSTVDWSSPLQNKSFRPCRSHTRQPAHTPRQSSTSNAFGSPWRSSTSNSNADSHGNSGLASVSTPAEQTCRCIPTALKINEQLKVYTISKGGRSMTGSDTVRKLDEDFHYLKQAIVRCSETLDCAFCSGQSSVMMLILSICEKMLESFGQLSSAFLAPPPSHQISRCPSSTASIGSSSRTLSMSSNPDVSNTSNCNSLNGDVGSGTPLKIFADAMLDTEDEVNIVKALVTARIKNLGSLLSRLEKLISSKGWSGHGDVLECLRSNYRRTAGLISKLEVQQ